MPRRISEETERIILYGFNKGMTREQIADNAGVHLNTVHRYCKKYDLSRRERSNTSKKVLSKESQGLETRLQCPDTQEVCASLPTQNTKGYLDLTQRATSIFRSYNHRNGNRWRMVKCDFLEDHSLSFCTLYQNTQNLYLFKIHLYQDGNLITEFNVRDGEKAVRVYYNMIPYFSNALAKGINTAELQKRYEDIKKGTYRPSKGVDSD